MYKEVFESILFKSWDFQKIFLGKHCQKFGSFIHCTQYMIKKKPNSVLLIKIRSRSSYEVVQYSSIYGIYFRQYIYIYIYVCMCVCVCVCVCVHVCVRMYV